MTTAAATEHPLSVKGKYRYEDCIGLLAASKNGFSGPISLDFSPDGLLYVLNRANPNQPEAVRVTICSKDSDYIDQFGQTGTGDGEFIWPVGLAVNGEGQVFVTDEGLCRVSAFAANGDFLYAFGKEGSSPGQFNRPAGLALDQQNNLYLVDSLNHRLQVLTARGEFIRQWGGFGAGPGQFNMPWGVALDPEGNVWVTDWRNDRVQKFTPEGKFLMQFGRSGTGEGEFDRPNGVAVDRDGDVYVCDWRNDRVQVFDGAGSHRDTLIGHGAMSRWARTFLDANQELEARLNKAAHNIPIKMRFYRPVAVKVDEAGKVFVADCYRHRVQIYQKLA